MADPRGRPGAAADSQTDRSPGAPLPTRETLWLPATCLYQALFTGQPRSHPSTTAEEADTATVWLPPHLAPSAAQLLAGGHVLRQEALPLPRLRALLIPDAPLLPQPRDGTLLADPAGQTHGELHPDELSCTARLHETQRQADGGEGWAKSALPISDPRRVLSDRPVPGCRPLMPTSSSAP